MHRPAGDVQRAADNLGGYPGLAVDVTLASDDDPCDTAGPPRNRWLFPVGEDLFTSPGEALRVIVLDVEERALAILLTTASDEELETFGTLRGANSREPPDQPVGFR